MLSNMSSSALTQTTISYSFFLEWQIFSIFVNSSSNSLQSDTKYASSIFTILYLSIMNMMHTEKIFSQD